MERKLHILHSPERSFLVLDKTSSSSQKTTSKSLSSNLRVCQGDVGKESSRKSEETHKMAIETVYGTKKGDRQAPDHSRSVAAESIYQLSNLQNAHPKRSQTIASSSSFHDFLGFEGRILACSYHSKKETLSRVRVSKHTVPIQSDAIRTKYCPQNFYKAHSSCIKSNPTKRNFYASVSGRFTDYCPDSTAVSEQSSDCNKCVKRPWLDHKRNQVQNDPSSGFSMVGSFLGSDKVSVLSSSRHSTETSPQPHSVEKPTLHFQTYDNASPGFDQLVLVNRSQFQTFNLGDQERTVQDEEMVLGFPFSTISAVQDGFDSVPVEEILPTSIGSSRSLFKYNDRHLRGGLGNKIPSSRVLRRVRFVTTPI